jgi:hypothetical protein
LDFLELLHSLLRVARDALFVKGQELELPGFVEEDLGCREGGVDFRVFGSDAGAGSG